jgi:hypothetical protein
MKSHFITALLLVGSAYSWKIPHTHADSHSIVQRTEDNTQEFPETLNSPDILLVGKPIEAESTLNPRNPLPEPAAAAAAQANAYINAVLTHHNYHRKNHSAPNVVHGATIARYAAKVAASCVFAHDRYCCPGFIPSILQDSYWRGG